MDNKQEFYRLYKINNNVTFEDYKGTKFYLCELPKFEENTTKKVPYRNQTYAKNQYEFNREMDNFIFSEDMLIELENIREIKKQLKKYNRILDKLKVSLKELFLEEYKKQYSKDAPDFVFKEI